MKAWMGMQGAFVLVLLGICRIEALAPEGLSFQKCHDIQRHMDVMVEEKTGDDAADDSFEEGPRVYFDPERGKIIREAPSGRSSVVPVTQKEDCVVVAGDDWDRLIQMKTFRDASHILETTRSLSRSQEGAVVREKARLFSKDDNGNLKIPLDILQASHPYRPGQEHVKGMLSKEFTYVKTKKEGLKRGAVVKDRAGQQWLVKEGGWIGVAGDAGYGYYETCAEHAVAHMASQLGLNVPETKLVRGENGLVYIASLWKDHLRTLQELEKDKIVIDWNEYARHVVVSLLLGNGDVFTAGNILFEPKNDGSDQYRPVVMDWGVSFFMASYMADFLKDKEENPSQLYLLLNPENSPLWQYCGNAGEDRQAVWKQVYLHLDELKLKRWVEELKGKIKHTQMCNVTQELSAEDAVFSDLTSDVVRRLSEARDRVIKQEQQHAMTAQLVADKHTGEAYLSIAFPDVAAAEMWKKLFQQSETFKNNLDAKSCGVAISLESQESMAVLGWSADGENIKESVFSFNPEEKEKFLYQLGLDQVLSHPHPGFRNEKRYQFSTGKISNGCVSWFLPQPIQSKDDLLAYQAQVQARLDKVWAAYVKNFDIVFPEKLYPAPKTDISKQVQLGTAA